jgi:hypothetical protein
MAFASHAQQGGRVKGRFAAAGDEVVRANFDREMNAQFELRDPSQMKVRFGQSWKKRVTHVPLGPKVKQLREVPGKTLGRAQGDNCMVSDLVTMREQMQGMNFESGVGCNGESIASVNEGILSMRVRNRPMDKAEAGLYYSSAEYTALRYIIRLL